MNYIEEIRNYLEQKNIDGSLLLEGKWGSGKTYFIDHQIVQNDEIIKKYIIIKVSLFGVETVQQLDMMVKKEYLHTKNYSPKSLEKIVSKNKNKMSSVKDVVEEIFPKSKAVLSFDWTTFIDIKENDGKSLFFIFDDFERCEIPYVQLTGKINEYLEMSSNSKVMIIANEEAINEDKRNEYIKYKEKIVYRTLHFHISTDGVFDTIINNIIIDNQYRTFIYENKTSVVNIYRQSKLNNIRSLKCAICDFYRFYIEAEKKIKSQKSLTELLRAFFALLFENKDNNIIKIAEKAEYNGLFEYGELSKKYNGIKQLYLLNSFKLWIGKGIWDKEILEEELNDIVTKECDIRPQIKLIYSPLFSIEDSEFMEYFEIIMEDAYAGRLNFDEYIQLIGKFKLMRECGIHFPAKVDYKKLSSGLEIYIEKLREGKERLIKDNTGIAKSTWEVLLEEEKNILLKISNYRRNAKYVENRLQLLDAFIGKNEFDIDLLELYPGALDELFIQQFYEFYDSRVNEEKAQITRRFLKSINSFVNYCEEDNAKSAKGLQYLKELLEKGAGEKGSIKYALYHYFSSQLTDSINKFNEQYQIEPIVSNAEVIIDDC